MRKPPRRFSGFAFWDGLGLGVFLGALVSIGLFACLTSEITFLINNSVGFAAIIASLFAAGLALKASRSQLDHSVEVEAQNRINLLIAEKSELPSALSGLISTSKEQIERIVEFDRVNQGSRPPISHDSFSVIKKCIQYADPISQEWLALILMQYQVLAARAEKPLKGTISMQGPQDDNGHHLISSAMDWAEFHAILAHIFGYARGKETIPDSFNSADIHIPFSLRRSAISSSQDFEAAIASRVALRKNAMPSDWFEK